MVLTDLAFNILLAGSDGPVHGYGLIKSLRRLEGKAGLRTGTVYAALARLEKEGLVREVSPPDDDPDERRRYYGVTAEGLSAARAEAARLAQIVERARRKHLLPEAPRV